MFGTPYTEALHVVERYRLLDYEAAKEGLERGAKENFRLPPNTIPPVADSDPNYRGKHLQLTFTVEDEGVFTTPWSATITYGRPPTGDQRGGEYACAEIRNPKGCRPRTSRISESWHGALVSRQVWVKIRRRVTCVATAGLAQIPDASGYEARLREPTLRSG
jgi:hypothetical protein